MNKHTEKLEALTMQQGRLITQMDSRITTMEIYWKVLITVVAIAAVAVIDVVIRGALA